MCVCTCVCALITRLSILLNPHCSALTVTVILKINLCPFSFCCLGTRNLLSIIFALCIIKKCVKIIKKNLIPIVRQEQISIRMYIVYWVAPVEGVYC